MQFGDACEKLVTTAVTRVGDAGGGLALAIRDGRGIQRSQESRS